MPNWKKVIVSGSSAHLNQITGSGGVKLPDGVRLNFGDSNDLKIYHSGAHSIIQDTGTGNLELKASIVKLRGTATGESMAHFTENAGVELYYDSSKKLDVVTGGVDVTGTIQASGNISGSSTSTGSFGRVEAIGSIGGNRIQSNGGTGQILIESPTGDGVGIGRVMSVGYQRPHAPVHIVGGSTDIAMFVHRDSNSATHHTGIGFGVWSANYAAKGGIFFERQGNYGVGKLKFAVDSVMDGNDVTPSETVMTITSASIDLADGIFISGSSTSHLTMAQVSSSGDVVADGDVIAYNSSDERLKDNIEVIKGSLDKIDGIRGVEFDWNDKSPGWAQERGHDIGVIAQEVQKVVPEIVVERKNGYLGVDYKRLVPLLIESVKELKQEVEDLKKKVN